MDTQRAERLNSEAVLKLLDIGGPISQSLHGFEVRTQQKSMVRDVLDAYNRNQVSLIEAGTGTGKSLAYLIPAIYWAVETGEKTVISTNTIALQEQLLHKDIPLLVKALKVPVKAVLVKGMSNYLCLRKLEEVRNEQMYLTLQESDEFRAVDMWSTQTSDGSRSSLSIVPSHGLWEKTCAESDTCTKQDCPFFSKCFFFKARKEAQEAQILIVNHHLLFTDLYLRANVEGGRKDPGILPPYTKVVLDEAHNIEDIATDYFANHVGEYDLRKTLSRLAAEKGADGAGRLAVLKNMLTTFGGKAPSQEMGNLLRRLTVDLPGMRTELQHLIHEAFTTYRSFMLQQRQLEEENPGENKLRILPAHKEQAYWKESIAKYTQALIDSLLRYTHSIKGLDQDICSLKIDKLEEQSKTIRMEIQAQCERLNGAALLLDDFLKRHPVDQVRWIQSYQSKGLPLVTLFDAKLDISRSLADHLFNKFSTVILCSATLSTNKQFHFVRKRLGLTPELLGKRFVKESIYDSPFDFLQQALLVTAPDMPLPTEGHFVQAAVERIWQAVEASRGNAFVLFTSYTLLNQCYNLIEARLKQNRYFPLKQGEDSRRNLLERFSTVDRSVLFGTDSFWEGVDVAGEALRCVIIVKLPFKVPSDPIIQARSESIQEKGGDPFFEYSLPMAIVKFKQGFGRLIRKNHDRGCVVCLDSRLIQKRYGAQFLNSLPQCTHQSLSKDKMLEAMQSFYRKTHYLTQKKD